MIQMKTNMYYKDEYVSPETRVLRIAIESRFLGLSSDPNQPTEPIIGGDGPDVQW